MENATKALLIAAAVLVAIIIISITLVIVKQGRETVSGADLSEIEAAEFNAPFLSYEGTNLSTAQVNALLNTVFQHNKQELATGEKRYVDVDLYYTERAWWSPLGREGTIVWTRTTKMDSRYVNQTNEVPSISGSSYYTVECIYGNSSGREEKTSAIITKIEIRRKY